MEATRFDNTRKKLVTLKKNKEFTFLYHRGKSCSTKLIVLIYFKNRYGGMRSGFSVSKKVGKAVVRNKVRRRLREIYRLHEGEMQRGVDLVFVARGRSVDATYAQLEQAVIKACKQLKVVKEQGET